MTLSTSIDVSAYRQPENPVEPCFVRRWSPRAMSGEDITQAELQTVFEAAKWAPSSFNEQPWRFLYARRNTPHWPVFFDLLIPGNQRWATHAAVLVVVIAKTTMDRDGSPSRTYAYDTGAAWGNLALQATMCGLVVHGMQGFDYEQAAHVLAVPGDYKVEAMVAIGKPGDPGDLPAHLQAREVPSPRKPVREIAWEGTFT